MKLTLTPNYHLESDERNFIVKKRHIVDPTKAPSWAQRAAEGADPSLREEYREDGYFAKSPNGLEAAIAHVSIAEADTDDVLTMTAFLAELRKWRQSITDVVERADNVKTA